MPDTWEYPWYASWDLAFHCIALAHLDPTFAKQQLVMLCREWFMHPNGQLPAYEWNFGDVNPPVLAYAALRVWEVDGMGDYEFLERIMHKLAINFNLPYLGVKRALGEISEDELRALAGRVRPGRTALRYFDQLEWDA